MSAPLVNVIARMQTPEVFREQLANSLTALHGASTPPADLVRFFSEQRVFSDSDQGHLSNQMSADAFLEVIYKKFGLNSQTSSLKSLAERISYQRSLLILKSIETSWSDAGNVSTSDWLKVMPFIRDVRDIVGVQPVLFITDIQKTIRLFFEQMQAGALGLYPTPPIDFVDNTTRCLTESVGGNVSLLPIKVSVYNQAHALGKGSSGEVVRGILLGVGGKQVAQVVVKKAANNPLAAAALRREEMALRYLGDDDVEAVPTAYGFYYTTDGSPCLITEYVDGKSLGHWIQSKGSNEQVSSIFWKVARALAECHRRGLVHLDIKPENIMVVEHGDSLWPVLIDFGNSTSTSYPEHRQIEGTLLYLPPEILSKVIENPNIYLANLTYEELLQWELWCLGLTLYQSLSGGPHPYLTGLVEDDFHQEGVAKEYHQRPNYVPIKSLNADLPDFWDKILEKCLSLDPNQRYQSVDDLIEDLSQYLINEKYQERFWQEHSIEGKVEVLKSWDNELFLKGCFTDQKKVFAHAQVILSDDESDRVLNAHFHYLYARSLNRLKKYREAQIELRKADELLINENSKEAHVLRINIATEWAFYVSTPEDAVRILGDVAYLVTPDTDPLIRGRFFMTRSGVLRRLGVQTGDRELLVGARNDAVDACREYLSINDEQRANEARSRIANCFIELKDYQAAVEILETARQVAEEVFGNQGPNVDTIYINLGDALRLNGDYQKAVEILTKARDLFPQSPHQLDLLEYLAEAYLGLRDSKEVEPTIDEMRKLIEKKAKLLTQRSGDDKAQLWRNNQLRKVESIESRLK